MNNTLNHFDYSTYTSVDEMTEIFSTEHFASQRFKQAVVETNTPMPTSYKIKNFQDTTAKQLKQKMNTRDRLRRKLAERKAKKANK